MASDETSGVERGTREPIWGRLVAWPERGVLRLEGGWVRFVEWFNSRELSEHGVILGFAAVIGVLSAIGVIAFYRAIDLAYTVFYRWPGTYLPRLSFLAYRPIVTAAGLALAWWVMRRLGRDHDGMNVPDVQHAVVRRRGNIPARPALARTLASAITIGGGGSAGSEGPVVVLGAAIGSWLGRTFRFAASRVTTLVGCATGAAISAAFNAPLAGAFFALEEILGSFGGASFSAVVVSSVVGAIVSRSVIGNHPAFPVPRDVGYGSLREVLLFYPILGLVCAVVAALYVRVYFAFSSWVRRWPFPQAALPWAGGIVLGALVFASDGRLVGFGHLAIHLELFGRMTWYALMSLALGKILATSLTLNAGGSGGVFTPSLFIGAATGGSVGVALAGLFPTLGVHPEAYALVGMGAMIAGATAAPITGILLVFEMTNDYAIMVPLMLTVVVTNIVTRRLERDSLYSGWLRRRGESIEQGADRDVLAGLRVGDAFERTPRVIGEGDRVDDFITQLGHTEQTYFPVVGGDGTLVGMITTVELGQIASMPRDLRPLIVATDLARPSESVSPDDSLLDAIRRMGVRGAAALPVVDPATGRFLGLVGRGHVLSLYERSLAGAANGAPASPSPREATA